MAVPSYTVRIRGWRLVATSRSRQLVFLLDHEQTGSHGSAGLPRTRARNGLVRHQQQYPSNRTSGQLPEATSTCSPSIRVSQFSRLAER
jgi:hypothetical protein